MQTAQQQKMKKTIKNVELFAILATSAIPCWGKKSITNCPTSIKKHLSNQHSKLDRFWSQLGSILGGFWGPSWGKIHSQIEPKTDRNQDEICNAFLIALGTQLGSKMDPIREPIGPPNHTKIHPKTTSKKMAIKKWRE